MRLFQDGINAGFVWCVACWVGAGFDGYTDGITHGFDEIIDLGISYWSFEVFNDVNHEGLVTGFQYGINCDVY